MPLYQLTFYRRVAVTILKIKTRSNFSVWTPKNVSNPPLSTLYIDDSHLHKETSFILPSRIYTVSHNCVYTFTWTALNCHKRKFLLRFFSVNINALLLRLFIYFKYNTDFSYPGRKMREEKNPTTTKVMKWHKNMKSMEQ